MLSEINQNPKILKSLNHEECIELCKEIRKTLIKTVSKNGGHLASNLGTVELTLSLHRNFNSPLDKIIWDVGHQAYTHKLLTGRYEDFHTIRLTDGISGFPKPSESEHDAFISGHSSTAVSAACGFAAGMRLDGDKNHYVVAVVGDGAMTGGMFWEGLNNAGKDHNANIIVILNNNNMSISKNVGAFAKYLSNIRQRELYVRAKMSLEKQLTKVPVIGYPTVKTLKYYKDTLKEFILARTMFEDMGFVYLGPVDGHSTASLDEVLKTARTYRHPVLIHVNTTKGKGYAPAEENPGEYHGVGHFDVRKCTPEKCNPEVNSEDTFSDVFGKELARLANRDKSICAVTAAMKYGTGLQYFASAHPSRFFDVGIAEQHAVTFCSALAKAGKTPVFAVYSSFLQRSFDQLIHDAYLSKAHVVLAIDRAGIIGADGETHQGIFDIAMLKNIPNSVIYSPNSYESLKRCLRAALYNDTGISAVRYPRGADCGLLKLNAVNETKKKTLAVSYGRLYNKLYNEIAAGDCGFDVLKLEKIYPIADEFIAKMMTYDKVVFAEEVIGGVSDSIWKRLINQGYKGIFEGISLKDIPQQGDTDIFLQDIVSQVKRAAN